ncbi:Chaperone protein HscA [Buchnera aphidicola (Tetraneura ulmi)]|uniref:Hsp70 family protein n=1 Tax=Buchnera aphidicola TaxID=9 RepID=UPI00346481A3
MSKIVLKKKLCIGFDLGTTNSLAARFSSNKIKILKDKNGQKLLPSVVKYEKNKILVGWNALKNYKGNKENIIFSIKRLIGLSKEKIKILYPKLPYSYKEDSNNEICIKTIQGFIKISTITSQILSVLKKRVINQFNREIDHSVITVPAYFDNKQRKEIKKSAFLAGLTNVRLLNEPTSAAIAYGCNLKKKELVAIYDLGGGTFDFSLLKLENDVFEVLTTTGNSHLGGDDFDFLLIEYIFKKYFKLLIDNEKIKKKIFSRVKFLKKELSFKKKVSFKIQNFLIEITRNEFNKLIEPLVKKTLMICKRALISVDIRIDKINEIILVGGSTHIPIIQKKIELFFKKKPLSSINPEEAVVIGSAIHSENLSGNISKKKKFLLIDVLHLSLGIEVMGGIVEKIIKKNTKLPTECTKIFTNFQDNQTSIKIHILQGEGKLVKDCRSLFCFSLSGITPQLAGINRIFINFKIDNDGLLHVSVVDKISKNKKNMTINTIDDFNILK